MLLCKLQYYGLKYSDSSLFVLECKAYILTSCLNTKGFEAQKCITYLYAYKRYIWIPYGETQELLF